MMSSMVKKQRNVVIPRFKSTRAEAEWFDKNRKKLDADMMRRLVVGDTMTLDEALARSAAKNPSN